MGSKNSRRNEKPSYYRWYKCFNYLNADYEIELVHKRTGDSYPQTREEFINTKKIAKNKKKFFI